MYGRFYVCVVRIKDKEVYRLHNGNSLRSCVALLGVRCVKFPFILRRFLKKFQKIGQSSYSDVLDNYIIYVGKVILFFDCVISS